MPEFSVFDAQELLGLSGCGIRATGQRWLRGRWQLACEVADLDTARACRCCGTLGRVRSSRQRVLVHAPVADVPVHLWVRVRTYECVACARTWKDRLDALAPPGCRLTGIAVSWALRAMADGAPVSACAKRLACSWHTVNDAALAAARGMLDAQEDRYAGVRAVGIDEHVWRHTPFGSRYATVIVDLTPRMHGGPARLLDIIEGRGSAALAGWMAARGEEFRRRVRVVAMDAFAGYKKAARRALPGALEVMDPFHVVALAARRVDQVRCRLQRETTGRRGVKGDRLYECRRALLKTEALRTARQRQRVDALLADPANQALAMAHAVYQRIIACYRCEDRKAGKRAMRDLVGQLGEPGVFKQCPELRPLARTLRQRLDDIVAYFDVDAASNGPTEAVNGRLETLRGIAMGFRSLDNYTVRSLIHSGRLKDTLTH